MKAKELYDILKENDLSFYAGVPDSLLKDFCAYISDNTDDKYHTICANEGNAIALASGYYLASGKPAVVYMQNSGLGNCVNPLLSLTDVDVYQIPLLMFIGWRGEPNVKDEPQHIKQGKVTDKLLEAMGIRYEILPVDFKDATPIFQNAINYINQEHKPFAFIVRKGTFEKYELKNKKANGFELNREYAIEEVIKHLDFDDIIVSTTGHISREVYETRQRLLLSHKQDFLTVGSMGHSSSIALGITLNKPNKIVYCFDGDGAFLMHEGAVTVIASKKLQNFKHIVFNNEAHDSVGAQPTVNSFSNIPKIALYSGYTNAYSVKTKEELLKTLPKFIKEKGTVLLEIKVKCGARADLGRPKEKPKENKIIFMENLKQTDFIYPNAIENLSKILNKEKTKKVLLFSAKNSYEKNKNAIEKQLKNFEYYRYNDFSVNPKEEDIKKALKEIVFDFDIIVAFGGGSVIDFAKAFKLYKNISKKLIAIPTTAGTGSEATQFSVLYVNDIKTSLDNPILLPDYAICDCCFIENIPKEIKKTCALDALCQAIESYWAVCSNPVSRYLAMKSIKILKENLVEYINNPNSYNSEKMMEASNLSGKAINISRTTASHAISYTLTSKYNIPHGHAVALTLPKLFTYNMNVNQTNLNDKRGVDFVKSRMNELKDVFGDFEKFFYNLFDEISVKYKLKDLAISDVDLIAKSTNIQRLNNNPVSLSEKDIKELFN